MSPPGHAPAPSPPPPVPRPASPAPRPSPSLPPPGPRRTQVLWALLAVYLIWGSTYLAMRWAARALPPLGLAGTRFTIAGLTLLAIQRATGHRLPTRAEWACSLPVGILMFVFGNGMVALAVRHLGSGLAAVVCATMPLFAALFSILLPKTPGDRPQAREWAGIVLGLVGVVILAGGRELRGNPQMAVVLFLAPIGWGLGSVLARRLPLPPGATSAATQMTAGGLALLVSAAIHGEHLPAVLDPRAVLATCYLIVFGSLVGFTAYTFLLQNVRPALAMSYAYVNPLIAVALGALFDAEAVTAAGLLATACVASAVALLIGARDKARAAAAAVPVPAPAPAQALPPPSQPPPAQGPAPRAA